MIGRPRAPEPDADSTAGRLIAATARIDQAVALADDILRDKTADTHMRNFALDVRNALNPPRRR